MTNADYFLYFFIGFGLGFVPWKAMRSPFKSSIQYQKNSGAGKQKENRKAPSITRVLLYPGHNFPLEYLSGSVMDYDIIELEDMTRHEHMISGIVRSKEFPEHIRLARIQNSQIASILSGENNGH